MSFPLNGGTPITLPLAIASGGTGQITAEAARLALSILGYTIAPVTINSDAATNVPGVGLGMQPGEEWIMEFRLTLTTPAGGSKVSIVMDDTPVYLTGAITSNQAAAIKTTIITTSNTLMACTGANDTEELIIRLQAKCGISATLIQLAMASTVDTENTSIAEGSCYTAQKLSN